MVLLGGFESGLLRSGEVELFYKFAGNGPPLLLLHGYPQTHVCWHKVAPALAERFSVVLPDLRGYGDSRGPPPDAAHWGYCKRAMAEDLLTLVDSLGFEEFFIAGHDRGGRVAYRLTLDHPKRVRRLAVIDIIPTYDMWQSWDYQLGMTGYHWTFLAQEPDIPERLIAAEPELYLRHLIGNWAGEPEAIDDRAMQAYLRAFQRRDVIRATCEDYRAGATLDFEHDRADRESGRRIPCPVLALYGARGLAADAARPGKIWRQWADDVQEQAVDCGHFVMEERPQCTFTALSRFFAHDG